MAKRISLCSECPCLESKIALIPCARSVFRNSELVGGVPLQSFNFGVRPRGSADRDAGTGVAGSSGRPATASADESELVAVDLMTEARYACLRDFVLGRPTRSHLLGEFWPAGSVVNTF